VVRQRERAEAERQRLAAESQKSDHERMLSVEGVEPDVAEKLLAHYGRVEQLIKDQDMYRVALVAGLSASAARRLHWAARVYLGDLDPDYAPAPEVDPDEPPVTEVPPTDNGIKQHLPEIQMNRK